MDYPFNNQVALITGAGSGLGRQLALELSRLGAVIAALDLKPEPLEALIAQLKLQNGAGVWEIGDVTNRASLHAAAASFTKRLGPVAMLVANAGIGIETSALNFHAEDVEKQIAVNLVGVANSVEAVLPEMLERGSGHLVAISSLASYRGVPKMAGYCASKAGVSSLMDALRVELRPKGIVCTTICPGWIRTALTEHLPDPKPAMLTVEEAARRIVWAIRRKKAYYAFPANPRLPLAFNRLMPKRLADWMLVKFLERYTAR
jgi:NAD(P)-dependent dehydrogenase (short-subunit alcohol dehydrogenase family)